MRVTKRLTVDDLPKAFKNFRNQMPFAISNALNDTAFEMRKHAIESEFAGDLTIRNRAQARRTTLVKRSTKATMRSELGSTAWYMEDLHDGRTRRPLQGVTHKGKKYLLVPDERTETGKKKSVRGYPDKPFVVKRKKTGSLWLVRRKKKKRAYPLNYIGQLVPRAAYDQGSFSWSEVVNGSQRVFRRSFNRQMVRAIRTAR